ncbi:hypothetical protein HNW13_010290 [Shewanella sp. BF02_Schw]|nr:hypothetical protein [Shewanella sp. BF02_Schw]
MFDKSLWLMASGIVLLLLRFAMSMNTNKTAGTEMTMNTAATAYDKEQP